MLCHRLRTILKFLQLSYLRLEGMVVEVSCVSNFVGVTPLDVI